MLEDDTKDYFLGPSSRDFVEPPPVQSVNFYQSPPAMDTKTSDTT